MKYVTLLYVDHVDFLAVYIVYQRNKFVTWLEFDCMAVFFAEKQQQMPNDLN